MLNEISPTADAIARSIITQMKESGHALWIDPETHALQHEFIAELIRERKEAKARRERIKEKIAGSVILSALLLIIGLIGAGALEWLRKHLT